MCNIESEEPRFQSGYFTVLSLRDILIKYLDSMSLFFKKSHGRILKLIESAQGYMENGLVSSVSMYCINLIFTQPLSCFSLPQLYITSEHGTQNLLQVASNNISSNLMQSETAAILSPLDLKLSVSNFVIGKEQHKGDRKKWFFFFGFCLAGCFFVWFGVLLLFHFG